MALFNRQSKRQGGRYVDEVIIGGNVYSVSRLKTRAKRLTLQMWSAVAITMLVAMTIVPYLANAAANGNNSNAFSGTVIPGYSMGGISVTAYGVDVNAWGMGVSDSGRMAKTNYGIWSGSRANGSDSSSTSATDMTPEEKSSGWKKITGRQNYTATNPSGQSSSSTSTDVVNPYRTASDATYWDGQTASSSASSPNINVSLLPEFVVVGKGSDGQATVLTNPDDTLSQASSSNQSMILKSSSGDVNKIDNVAESSAIPHYISLRDLFDAYGLDKSSDTMTDLTDAMSKDKGPLNRLVNDDSKDLLHGTSYTDLNGTSGETSDAFNPYPYSMVFTKTDNGRQVVSGIYENSEAYAYFSPQSMYEAYLSLAKEYESIVSNNASELDASSGSVKSGSLILRLGYYQAAMSICEAYLTESLPQDMTRGYVGPIESSGVSGYSTSTNGGDWRIGNSDTHANNKLGNDSAISSKIAAGSSEAKDFNSYTYATLMYDIANQLTASGESYSLSQTNATMDTLSTFGYNVKGNDSIRTGVMRGMNAAETYNRMNAFTAYSNDASADSDIAETNGAMSIGALGGNAQVNAGIYVAPYYPVQQHCIPQSERDYRFSVVNDIPFQTVKAYLSYFGFNAGTTTLSYASGQFDATSSNNNGQYSTLPTESQQQSLENLIGMFQTGNNNGNTEYKLNTEQYKQEESVVLHPNTMRHVDDGTESEGDADDTTSQDLDTQERVDQALLNYGNSSMTADNVHDLCDVVRSIGGLKYETFMRFYNPLKASGADPDMYLTRVSPAGTSYMPSMLLTGYSAAGGQSITNGTERTDTASYDYFSIPSFAPCFAQHTANDCYYGALNYELRAFLQTGFLSTVYTGTGGVNIPAVTAASSTVSKARALSDKEIIDAETMRQNLRTMLNAAQTLCIAETIDDAQNGMTTLTAAQLRRYVKSAVDTDARRAYDFASQNGYSSSWLKEPESDVDAYYSANGLRKLKDANDNTQIKLTKEEGIGNPLEWLQKATDNSGYVFHSDDRQNLFDYAGNIGTDTATAFNVTIGDDGDDSLEYLAFSYLYRQKLVSLIDDGGKYHWCSINDLRKRTDVYDLFDTNETDTSLWKNAASGAVDNKGNAESALESSTGQLFKEINNFYSALNGLSSSMPSQMQNALAWANYANSSNSQNAYQSDPSESTTTVVVSGTSSTNKTNADTPVTNIATANKMKTSMNGSGAIVGESQDATNMQSKTKRGVEGTTSTATGNPASYTTTAIVARTQKMTRSDSAYPYSGLASSSLIEGADRYSQMQSQVIDYTNIANGLDNDLSNFKETTAVTLDIDNPSLLDSLDLWGKMKGFFADMSTGLVKMSGNLFKSQVFPDDSSANGNVSFAGKSSANADTMTASTIASMFSKRSSYVASVSASHPNMTRTALADIGYDGSAPRYDTQSASVARAAGSNGRDEGDSKSNTMLGGNVGAAAINFILNTESGKNAYTFLQSVALLFVMVSIIIIAFQNLLVYQSGNSSQFINAQATLKSVLPRAILSVFMIGLPIIGNGKGFQGGGFLLLEAVNSIARQIASVFSTIEGTGIIDMTIKGFTTLASDSNVFIMVLGFLLSLVVALLYLIGTAFVFLLNLFLFLFFVTTPLAWGLYVWPFRATSANGDKEASIADSIFGRITRKLGSKTFTGSKVGTEAAAGFVSTFVDIEIIFLIYVLLMWFVSYVFVGTAGDGWLNSSMNSNGWGNLGAALWLTVLNGGVIYIMGKLLMDEFRNTNAIAGMRNIAYGIVNGVSNVASAASPVASAVAGIAGAATDGMKDRLGLSDVTGVGAIDTHAIAASLTGDNQLSMPSASETQDAVNLAASNDERVTDTLGSKPGHEGEGDSLGDATKTDDEAIITHADNLNARKGEPVTMLDRAKNLGHGLLDGNSQAVGVAMGGIAGTTTNALGGAVHGALENAAYRLGHGDALADAKMVARHPIESTKYALGTLKDGATSKLPDIDAIKLGAKTAREQLAYKDGLNALDKAVVTAVASVQGGMAGNRVAKGRDTSSLEAVKNANEQIQGIDKQIAELQKADPTNKQINDALQTKNSAIAALNATHESLKADSGYQYSEEVDGKAYKDSRRKIEQDFITAKLNAEKNREMEQQMINADIARLETQKEGLNGIIRQQQSSVGYKVASAMKPSGNMQRRTIEFQQAMAEHDHRERDNSQAYDKLSAQRQQKQQERAIATNRRLQRQQRTSAPATRHSFVTGMNDADYEDSGLNELYASAPENDERDKSRIPRKPKSAKKTVNKLHEDAARRKGADSQPKHSGVSHKDDNDQKTK